MKWKKLYEILCISTGWWFIILIVSMFAFSEFMSDYFIWMFMIFFGMIVIHSLIGFYRFVKWHVNIIKKIIKKKKK